MANDPAHPVEPKPPKVDRRRLEGTLLTEKQRHDRASRAGNALLRNYGLDYFSALGSLSAKRRRAKEAARLKQESAQAQQQEQQPS